MKKAIKFLPVAGFMILAASACNHATDNSNKDRADTIVHSPSDHTMNGGDTATHAVRPDTAK